jgi:hypothetical protein|tara:strand:- start:6117 stop:6320 length:204 start_codon:yes stop_codon:yes gene_type:complete
MPEWVLVEQLFNHRLESSQKELEQSDEKNFRFEQGRLKELRFFLNLETAAKAVLDKARLPSRNTAID